MSVAELLHSNLCLLGYEKEVSAAKIILSDDTFEHANERAFQSVVHFLLRALDEERCRLVFRHCWPVIDKKQSSVFRQAVVAWLKELKQSDPDGDMLPQINPALFLSPGGRRFKDLLLGLTQFVMVKSLQRLDAESPAGEMLLCSGDPELQCGTLRAACALGRERFVQLQKARLVTHSHHQRFADVCAAQYRRLRQSVSALTLELGRLVAVSDLPPELTHRLLQQNADQVVPAVYGAARQHLSALVPALERLRQFSAETEYCWRVTDSIATGAVEESAVDARSLVTAPDGDASAQGSSELLVDGKLDLLAFFEAFVEKVEHLRQSLSYCPVGELKGLHGTLPPLVREATQLSADAGRLLAQLETETDSTNRRLERLLAAEPPPPPRAIGRASSPPPPPLLAPRTPNWSLSAAPLPPPGDHPLKHMYRSPARGGVKLDLELSSDVDRSALSSSRFSSLTTVTTTNGGTGVPGSPWASPAAAPPSLRLTGATPGAGRCGVSPAGGEDRFRLPVQRPVTAAPESVFSDTGRLTPTPGRSGRSATALSSCSSVFSPVASGAGRSSDRGSVSSLVDSVLEAVPSVSDASRARSPAGSASSPGRARASPAGAAGGSSPSPQVMRLRERTSAFLRSLTGSPAAGGDSVCAAPRTSAPASPPLSLQLPRHSGESWSGARGQPTWQEGRLSRSGPSSPRSAQLPRVAWEDGVRLVSGPVSPVPSPPDTKNRRRTRSGPGAASGPLLDLSPPGAGAAYSGMENGARLSPAAVSGVGVTMPTPEKSGVGRSPARVAAEEPPVSSEANFSRLEDEMAEALAMSVFGPSDFNHSLDFSHRESLGGVELSLVHLDDSDCESAPGAGHGGPGDGPGHVEPPTDLLIDI